MNQKTIAVCSAIALQKVLHTKAVKPVTRPYVIFDDCGIARANWLSKIKI